MKKSFVLLMAVSMASSIFANGQVDADFEADSIPAGWTVAISPVDGYKGGFSVVSYTAESSLKVSNVGTNDLGGNYALLSLTGATNKVKGNSDNWLISPEFAVADTSNVFSFRLAANCSYSPTKEAAQKMKMDIVVIGADSSVVATIAPENYFTWKQYAIDLSAYMGKTVKVAFHDYGTAGTGAIGDMKYIDNIRLDSVKVSDYAVVSKTTLYGQAQYTADYTVNVTNYGCAKASFTVSYQIGDAAPVSEKVDSILAVGKSIDYTFQTAPCFVAGDTATLKVWVEAADNAMPANDSLAAQTIIAAAKQALPYSVANVLTDEDTENDDFVQTEFTTATGSSYAKWSYDAVKYNAWIFSLTKANKSGLGYLYTTKAFTLPAGKVVLKTIGTATLTDNYYEVYVAQYGAEGMADYATKVGQSDTLRDVTTTETIDTTTVELTIPEAGDYILGIRPMTVTKNAQMTIIGFSIEDPAVTAIENCSDKQSAKAGKYLLNGRFGIVRNGKSYDVCGREL